MYPSFPRTLLALLVDQDPARSEKIRSLLEGVGVDVIQATTLPAALAAMRVHDHIQAVLLDLELDTGEKGATLDRIRASAPTVAVVILGRDEEEVAAREALRSGAQGLLLDSQLHQGSVYRTVTQAVIRSQTEADRALAEGALLECENRYRALFDLCRDAICVVDAHAVICDANRAALDLLGLSEQEFLGLAAETLLVRGEARDRMRAAMLERKTLTELEVPIQGLDGTSFWGAVSVVPRESAAGEERGCYVVFQSMTGAVALRGGFYDPLTGLPNRALLLDRLNYVLSRGKRREGFLFAVLFVDLDRFKDVNDQCGHSVGDDLLREVAGRLTDSIREEDTAARLGGDEFVVVLAQIDAIEDATVIADRILDNVGRSFHLSGREIRIGCSIGITVGTQEGPSSEELLRQADYAMYQAKSHGAGEYQIYDQAMQQHVLETLQLDAELRRALTREEFVVYYQPVVEAETGLVRGFEALLRWQHPQRGLLAPGDFISAAEERGFIEAIGRWVFEEVCRQLKEWRDLYPTSGSLEISVNLSALEFLRPDFVDDVQRAMREHGIPGRLLRLELTESTLVVDPASTLDTLKRLRNLGIRVSIDDFGLGLSSWSYLGQTSVDCFKIPRSSVADRGNGETPQIQQIAQLARCLGFTAVAQGVETEEELQRCRAAGSPLAQGYLFWRPLEAAEAGVLLEGSGPGPTPSPS